MKPSKALLFLSSLVAILALIASGAGLFWPAGEGQPFNITSVRGDEVRINGQGLYQHDTTFKAPILRGADAVTVFIAVPLLIAAIVLASKGRLRGQLLLAGLLSYFLYNAISLALGAFFNELVLVYVVYFSASLFAFILAFSAVDVDQLAARISARAPRRGMAIFMFVAGLTVFVWLPEMIAALLGGPAPAGLGHYTTEVTYILDPALIAPSAFVASYLLFRAKPLGYLLGVILLILNALVGVIVIGQTVMQTQAGISLSPGQLIAFVGSFTVMGLFALALLVKFFGSIAEPA